MTEQRLTRTQRALLWCLCHLVGWHAWGFWQYRIDQTAGLEMWRERKCNNCGKVEQVTQWP